jgi:putative DNA primase/helicase
MAERTGAHESNPLCSIRIDGEGFDEWGNRYLRLKVEHSELKLPPFSMGHINSDPRSLYTALCNVGVNVLTQETKRHLLKMLEDKPSEAPNFKVATYPGWHGSLLVFPDGSFGGSKPPTETSFLGLGAAMVGKYRSHGTLKDWQERVWPLCVGNSRLIFALSLAAAPLILPLVKGPRSGGFQLVGPPEAGKTCAAMVAGSFWGCHQSEGRREKGFAESWNTTEGQLEVTALAHNHSLLILDETKRAGKNDAERAENVLSMAVALAEHTERERMTNSGSARSSCCYILSTSNHTLDELARRGQVDVDDAERGRLVDVPLPAVGLGLYENIHGFHSGAIFTDELKSLSRRYYGTPRHAFAEALVVKRKKDKAGLKKWLKRRRSEYLTTLRNEVAKMRGADPSVKAPLQRASDRFATVFAAGAFAAKHGIYPCSRDELLTAILSCQLDGLRSLGKSAEMLGMSLKARLVQHIRRRISELMDLDSQQPTIEGHKFGSVPGYLATHKGERWVYLTDKTFGQIVGTGDKADALKQELVAAGLMDRAKSRFVVQRRIFSKQKGNKGHRTVLAFKEAILASRQGDVLAS